MSEKWEAEATSAYFSNNGEVIVEYRVKHPIKEISKPEAVANAQLIAAAPELLEAAEQSYEMIDTLAGLSSWDARSEDEINEVMNRNLKAIKKAKGDDE